MEQLARIESSYRENRTRRLGYRLIQLEALHKLLIENAAGIRTAISAGSKSVNAENLLNDISDLVAGQGQELYHRFEDKDEHSLQNVSASSVLIVSAASDPLASLVCPLAFAISAGACVVLKPNNDAPHIQALISQLLPRYLDRECFSISPAPTTDLLNLDFEYVCRTGSDFIASKMSKRQTWVECEAGVNVLCLLDSTGICTTKQCADVLALSTRRATSQARINVALVLNSEINTVSSELASQIGGKVQMEPPEYLLRAPKSAALVLIGVSSTEEALLYLQKSNISRLHYFGDESYGAYLLKFLPSVPFGTINKYDPSLLYPTLSWESFQRTRRVETSKRPGMIDERSSRVGFPTLVVDYSKPHNFFLLGYRVSTGLLRLIALSSVGGVCLGLWRWYR